MKRSFIVIVLLISTNTLGVTKEENGLFSISNENTPALNTVTTRFLGDKMTVQRTGRYLPCYKFRASLKKSFFGTTQIIEEGDLFCRDSIDATYYVARKPTSFNSGIEVTNALDLRRGKKTSKVCLLGSHCFKKVQNDVFTTLFDHGNFLIIENDSLQKSIEYSGKSGSILTFTYSEYKDSMARDAFTREFKVDLNEGKVAGFKGAIFEINSADNVQITCKVIRHFSRG